MFSEGLTLPLIAQYSGLGAGFMVAFVGAALLAIAVALCVQILRGINFEPEEAEGVDLEQPVSNSGLALAATGIVLPIVTIPWLGFSIGAAIAYACVTRSFGSLKPGQDGTVGLILSIVIWYLFTKLGVQLGPLFPLIGTK